MESHIDRTITKYIREQFLQDRPNFELSENTNLVEESILDSLAIFLLMNFLREEFDIEIEAQEVTLENFETVRRVSDMVESKLGSGRQSA